MSRSIIHLDADSFFASVEQSADARLRGKAIAVGGESRGVIASASYEARKFGVKSAMPTSRARKLCPKLIVLPGDFDRYEQFSRWMFEYAYDFTPDVEIASIDEGFFDVTGCGKSAVEIAGVIQKAIRQRLNIGVSEGMGSNKLVSQIASKLKKPSAFLHVPFGEEIGFLHPLPNFWLPGVGPKLSDTLNAAGLARVGQIAATAPDLLCLFVGKMAVGLRNMANGIDERPVVPVSVPQKSFSQQETFAQDQTDEEFVLAVLKRMADQLMAKVREENRAIRTMTLRIRYNDMSEESRSESLCEPTDLETELYSRINVLLKSVWKRRVSLRLVSLKFSNVYDSFGLGELALDPARTPVRHELAVIMDGLRERMGQGVIMRGHDLFLKNRPEPLAEPESMARLIQETKRHQLTLQQSTPQRISPSRKSPVQTRFVPLEVHSYYDFLNSTLSIPEIVAYAKRHELPAVAMADPNLHGAVELFQAARAAGIKPIIGAEVLLSGEKVRLYVENITGYRNLCRMLSDQTRGDLFSGDQSLDGLIAVSPQTKFAALFPNRFYLAITHPDQL
ncbi:MAG: DNA polymerase IV, partial [Verrucomicrobiota bacterium]